MAACNFRHQRAILRLLSTRSGSTQAFQETIQDTEIINAKAITYAASKRERTILKTSAILRNSGQSSARIAQPVAYLGGIV